MICPRWFSTGDISTETLIEVARQGYVHRAKPIGSAELTGVIRALLSRKRLAEPRVGMPPPCRFRGR